VDTCDLVQAQDLDVYDSEGNPSHEIYLDILETLKAEKPHIGIEYILIYKLTLTCTTFDGIFSVISAGSKSSSTLCYFSKIV
jgi:hypothetical protein